MRTFVIIGHQARTDGTFVLDDLPGSGGRMDLLSRCIGSTLLLSHGLRTDTDCYLILQGEPRPPKTVCIRGSEVRSLGPDERSTGALLRKALALPVGIAFRASSPGIYVRATGLEELLKERTVALADENGEDIRRIGSLPETYILGDHLNLTTEEEQQLGEVPRVSVGPRSLHADHAITLIHNEIDRRENAWT